MANYLLMKTIGVIALPALWALLVLLTTEACTNDDNRANANSGKSSRNVLVWTSRVVPADPALFKQFETRSSLAITLEIMPDEEMLRRLAANEKPDLVIFSDFSYAEKAKRSNLLQSFVDKKLQKDVPIRYSDASNQWIGLSKWALGVVYSKQNKNWAEVNYADLGAKGPFAWSKATHPYLTTMIAAALTPAAHVEASKVAEGLKNNRQNATFDTDESCCMAVAEGKIPAALINSAAFFRWKNSGNPEAFAASDKLSLVFPVNEQGKTCYHLTTAAIPVGAARKNEAVMLVEFLSTKESQSFYSESAFEFPVNLFALPSDLLMQNGVFLEMPLDWAEVNQQLEIAQQLIK